MIRRKALDRSLFVYSGDAVRTSGKNFYCRLDSVVDDWSLLCAPLESVFSPKRDGRPVDPVVYFKIFLVGYLENITFDTDLAERIGDSLAIREFLGYNLDERTPDHSSIGRVRARFMTGGKLEEVFESVVRLCISSGLVGGEHVAIDSTLLPANASLSSLRSVTTKLTVKEHLDRLEEAGEKPSVSNKEFSSQTDPDSKIARKGSNCPRGMYHKATHVTDGKSQVIVSAQVTPADVGDTKAAVASLAKAKAVLEQGGLGLKTVLGDAGYDDSEFHAHLEAIGATPLTHYVNQKGGKKEGFRKSNFTYDPEQNIYRCPQGAVLKLDSRTATQSFYHASPADCSLCPFRSDCLGGNATHRTINRPRNEEARQRNIDRCHTDEGREALKKRKTIVEPPFAHMKRLGGMRILNCRGAQRVQAKVTMAAITWNLMKLVKHASLNNIYALVWALSAALNLIIQALTATPLNHRPSLRPQN